MEKRIKEVLNISILFIISTLLIGVAFIWVYNFLALSEGKLFDNNNKLVNQSLGEVSGNYYDYYETKKKTDNILFSYLNLLNSSKAFMIVIFIGFILIGLIYHYRKDIIKGIEKYF